MTIRWFRIGAVFCFLTACSGYGAHDALTPAGPTKSSNVLRPQAASAGTHIDYYNLGSNPNTDLYGYRIVQGPDAAMYYSTLGPVTCVNSFCSSRVGSVGRLNPSSGGFQEITLSASAYDLRFTRDYALWAAEFPIGKLARITLPLSSSNVTEISVPPPGTGATPEPHSLANGPDGNLWFADYGTARIGKINPLGPLTPGAMTMYQVPSGAPGTFQASARPYDITAGPDGNLWFTDRINGQIDKSTTNGAITTYVTPEQLALSSSNSSFPAFITSASGQTVLYAIK